MTRLAMDKQHPLYGKCYVVAEALYHIWAKAAGFRPMHLTYKGVSHWWLQGPDGTILDLTQGQFLEPFPYVKGRYLPFLTKASSKRTREFLGVS
jgi:hypothetical protein